MIIERKEKWGKIIYDTKEHSFDYRDINSQDIAPYPTMPLVLNVDLSFKCNMACVHCVAEDMAKLLGGKEKADLIVTDDLINKINKSPFMVIVFTGGEPFFPDTIGSLNALIEGMRNKAIIIDTNGTIVPPAPIMKLIKSNDILVRVSWDIPHPAVEVKLRKYPKNLYQTDTECMANKENFIKMLIKQNVPVAVQSVLHKYNFNNNNFYLFPHKFKKMGIKHWYIQRFIPSHKTINASIDIKEYNSRIKDVLKMADSLGVKIHHKMDRRHNSVFLMVKDGDLYTQSDKKAGVKIKLGKIDEVDFFSLVSAPDHAARYLA